MIEQTGEIIKYAPKQISDTDMAFGGKAMEILPKYSEIPEEFKRQGNKWTEWQSSWFFSGLDRYPVPKDGIDLKLAIRNLKCVMGSWDPKHEHKQAGVAYLASLWFSSPNGEPVAKKKSAA